MGMSILIAMSSTESALTTIPSWLSDEVAIRMDEKLSIIRLKPERILQSGRVSDSVITRRFSQAQHYFERPQLLPSLLRRVFLWLARKPIPKLISQTSHELAPKMNMIWSNLELHLVSDPDQLIEKWRRVLKPESLLMFSYLGPDTGRELRALLDLGNQSLLEHSLDMHDIGDALMKAQFAEPVMDMEYITLEYEEKALLIKDAVSLGLLESNHLDTLNWSNQPLKLTLEIVYGHAWTTLLAKTKQGEAVIRPDQITRKY
jgi:malonyl-CoA O-methyltransferase